MSKSQKISALVVGALLLTVTIVLVAVSRNQTSVRTAPDSAGDNLLNISPTETATDQLPVAVSSITPATSPKLSATRREIVKDREGNWILYARGTGDARCLELVVGTKTFRNLLCGAPPSGPHVGHAHSLNTSQGRVVVVVVDPTVTGLDPLPRQGGRISPRAVQSGKDPSEPGMAYAAGIVSDGDGVVDLVVESGDDKVAAVTLPSAAGSYSPRDLQQRTGSPYGRWPGYRHAGNAGLLFGGLQQVGFYDGSNGIRCILYRRFLGMAERILHDACPSAKPSEPSAHAILLATDINGFEDYVQVLVVSDSGVDGLRCELPSGEECRISPPPSVAPDPNSKERAALIHLDLVFIGDADYVTLILTRSGSEVGRVRADRPA